MKISVAIHELHPRRAFRISRGQRLAVENVFLRVEHDGVTGYGEASPNPFYRETARVVADKLEAIETALASRAPGSATDIAHLWEELWPLLSPSRAAQCALDLALWDWLAKSQQKSVAALALGSKLRPVESFCTIGLSTPEELVDKVAELAGFPWIKIKSDHTADLAPVRFVRERSSARLAVDANCAWNNQDLQRLSAELQTLGVEFLEQPYAPSEDVSIARAGLALPVLADESCVTEDDVVRAAEHFSGFNIKLVKCGGLTPGLRMLRRGRALGCKMMVGCMLESSLLIAAGAVIGQQTDYADLDGAWLLADDPFAGLPFRKGRLQHEGEPTGLGVTPPASLFKD